MAACLDQLVRTLSSDGAVSIRVLVATDVVRDAVRRHGTSPTATVALGRALMGTLLLATEAADGETVQIQILGNGPLGTVTVTANSAGEVRGYAAHPHAEPGETGGALDVARAVGLGVLRVERNHPSWSEPYTGMIPLASGEIAQDVARYLLESEQKPSAVALGVYLDPDGTVGAAAGYLVQGLPGADLAALDEMEQRIGALGQLSRRVHDGASAEDLAGELLGKPVEALWSRVEPRFYCPCDVARVERAATLLGRDEIREIIRNGETLEVRCAFCAEIYHLTPDQLGAALPDA